MCPEIRSNGKLIADVPDVTGQYNTIDGAPLYVDVTGINVHNEVQRIVLAGPTIGGQRVVIITHEGMGATTDCTKRRKGDQQDPPLEVMLKERPIRVSYHKTKLVWHDSRSLSSPRGGQWREVDDSWSRHNPYWYGRR